MTEEEKKEKLIALAISNISKTDGYKAMLAILDENAEACELIATNIDNANSHGVMAFANGGIEALKRLKMQIENLAALKFEEQDAIEP